MTFLNSAWTGVVFAVEGAFKDYWTALAHPIWFKWWALIPLAVLLVLVALWGKRQMTIRHSTLKPHQSMGTWSVLLIAAYSAFAISVTHLDVALMTPTVPEKTVQHLVQTRNVCIINDNSGSMTTVLEDGAKELKEDEVNAKKANDPTAKVLDSNNFKLSIPTGEAESKEDPNAKITRAQASRLAARYIIRHRMTNDPLNTDRFCLMRFDDDIYMMAPLTNDKLVLLLRTAHIAENVGGGTNFVVGLQKTYDYLMSPGTVSPGGVRVIVMVTDGFDSIDPEKRKEFIALYKEARIKFYVIGLGEGWKDGNTLDLQKFADELHAVDPQSGIVFRANNPGQMQKAMEKIDELEKAQEIVETRQIDRDVDYVFIAGSIFWIIVFFGFATLARRNP